MKYYVEFEVKVSGSYSPFREATMYAANGDPGSPAEGGELEDFTVSLFGEDITSKLDSIQLENLRLEFIESECNGDDQEGDKKEDE